MVWGTLCMDFLNLEKRLSILKTYKNSVKTQLYNLIMDCIGSNLGLRTENNIISFVITMIQNQF